MVAGIIARLVHLDASDLSALPYLGGEERLESFRTKGITTDTAGRFLFASLFFPFLLFQDAFNLRFQLREVYLGNLPDSRKVYPHVIVN